MRKFPFLAKLAVDAFVDAFRLNLNRAQDNNLQILLRDVSEVCNQISYRPVSF